MSDQKIPQNILKTIKEMQAGEITEYHIYSKLAKKTKDKNNAQILQKIADDEKRHSQFWEKYTHKPAKPNYFKVFYFYLIARLFGLTFGIKLMEKGEKNAQVIYQSVLKYIPEAQQIIDEEDVHEKELIAMINEEMLEYVGSIVLGLNDALVELTGALAGLTFALQNTRLIALTGLITGIAASFSMAASEYLSNKSEGEKSGEAIKSSLYTGTAYIITVILLIIPFLMGLNVFLSLGLTLFIAILIIFLFNYYISVAKDYSFKKRFFEMATISIGVAALSFGIGAIIKLIMPVEI
ncbi:MAG: VIT1/CCC1 transporter family protein [Spirochaetes bacterium]|nr:VIT1/CCC1 transporter family protein [Spirochaetota bacterium]